METIYDTLSCKFRTPIADIKSRFNTLQILNESQYKNSRTILRFRCILCTTEFDRKVCILKRGHACPVCSARKIGKSLKTTQVFGASCDVRKQMWIEKCQQMHPGLFIYDKVEYTNKCTKVVLGCVKCDNDFEILPSQLSVARNRKIVGCPSCNCKQRGRDRSLPKEEIIERIKLKWSVVDWKNATSIGHSILVSCNECGYNTLGCIGNLIKNYGCMQCYNKRRGDTLRFTNKEIIDRFIEKWGELYTYNKVQYTNIFTSITVTCKIHGDFATIPHDHERGIGCPECKTTSEIRVFGILKELFPDVIYQYKIESCKKVRYLPFDYYIPSQSLIIELDGNQHFKHIPMWKNNVNQQIERDVYKMKIAHENGIRVLRIYQPDVYRKSDKWIADTILENINNCTDKYIFISSNDTIYNTHKQKLG